MCSKAALSVTNAKPQNTTKTVLDKLHQDWTTREPQLSHYDITSCTPKLNPTCKTHPKTWAKSEPHMKHCLPTQTQATHNGTKPKLHPTCEPTRTRKLCHRNSSHNQLNQRLAKIDTQLIHLTTNLYLITPQTTCWTKLYQNQQHIILCNIELYHKLAKT